MAVDKIKRAITWLRKTLVITEKTELPGLIEGTIVPILDALGWDLLQTTENVAVATAGPATSSPMPRVPAEEAHWFVAVDVFHDDAAAPHVLEINYQDPGNFNTGIAAGISVVANQFVVLNRPILVLAGARIVGVSADAVPALSDLTVRGHFFRFNVGENIPGSPYG